MNKFAFIYFIKVQGNVKFKHFKKKFPKASGNSIGKYLTCTATLVPPPRNDLKNINKLQV